VARRKSAPRCRRPATRFIYGGCGEPHARHGGGGGAGRSVEILFAPAYAPDALEELRRTKKKCRVFEVPCDRTALPARLPEYRSVLGGLLAQSADLADLDAAALKTVSKRAPTPDELAALRFAWRVAKHTRSNAIVLATRDRVVGVGGVMNRVDPRGSR
jgi:phosphoribosylaminoimidazolecarboxamide formyltransferase/IMP cyclohydrolase